MKNNVIIRIGGMTCQNCETKIETELRNTSGVEKAEVSYNAGTAAVTYDPDIVTIKDIAAIIEKLDYRALTDDERRKSGTSRIIGLLIIIVALYTLLEHYGLLNLLAPSQLADEKMGYGMLFVIGLLTSVHCIAMCGGINLSQCIPHVNETEGGKSSVFMPAFLYNGGRVLSYTAIGFAIGALGAAITLTNTMQGVLKLIAGAFMIIMGINMLGLFPWLRALNPRMPKIFAQKINKEKRRSKSPLIVGLLNGFMPCGPLQAMQIYALSTGSPVTGALSMFLFSMGTVPLMFGLGAISSLMGKKFTGKAMAVGAVLVVVLGLSMLTQGLSLSGMSVPVSEAPSVSADAQIALDVAEENSVQTINSSLLPWAYPAITVQAGTPVKWVINAPQGSINGCNNRIFIREFGIEHTFKLGENVIEFMPENVGTFQYTCWMGMIRSTITVVNE